MMKLKKRSLKNSYNKMQNLKSVDDSTQVGSEEKKSSQRERKFEDEYDNYDSEVVYPDEVDEDEEYWNRSFEDIQELIDDSEIPREDNEE